MHLDWIPQTRKKDLPALSAPWPLREAVLFAELMTCAALFTLRRLDGIPRSMPLIHGLLLAGGLMALDERLNQNFFVGRAVDWHRLVAGEQGMMSAPPQTADRIASRLAK